MVADEVVQGMRWGRGFMSWRHRLKLKGRGD